MGRKAVITVGGVALKKGRIVNSQKAMIELATEADTYLNGSGFLASAPFELISLIFRYGDKFGAPCIEQIDKKNRELPVAIEVPLNELRTASLNEVKLAFASVMIPALRAVADRYKLPESGIQRFCFEHGYEFDEE